MSELADRLAKVRDSIAAACVSANRPPDSVTLIAVSKTHPAETLIEAAACGQVDFGENRVEEASTKIPIVQQQVKSLLVWHMIGHVQSRKARDVIQYFDVVHSLDSLKLAQSYSRLALESKRERPLHVLLEVNVSGEASKSGFDAANWQSTREQRESLWAAVRQIAALPAVQIAGLMTIAPIVENPEAARPVFHSLRLLRDALAADFSGARWDALSMGMSDDYPIAISEGATMVRVGRAIFGERVTH